MSTIFCCTCTGLATTSCNYFGTSPRSEDTLPRHGVLEEAKNVRCAASLSGVTISTRTAHPDLPVHRIAQHLVFFLSRHTAPQKFRNTRGQLITAPDRVERQRYCWQNYKQEHSWNDLRPN